jgi:TPR repeat protein
MKALDWYRKGAMKGQTDAQHALGRLYLEGKGVTRNVSTAFSFFESAAKSGHRRSAEKLGRLYGSGELGPPDHEKSMHWFMKSRNAPAKDPEELNLKSLALRAAHVRHLPEEIGPEHPWRVLDLSGNALDDEAARDIARLIRRDTRLREIRLSGNPLGASGLQEIAEAMRNNLSLMKVPVTHEPLGEDGAQAKRIDEECARNLRLGNLFAHWKKVGVEDTTYFIPAELVRLLGETLIVQDQKSGATGQAVEATQLRLAMLRLSMQELAKPDAALAWKQ